MNTLSKKILCLFLMCIISLTMMSCTTHDAVESDGANTQHQHQVYLIDNKTYADSMRLQQKGIALIDDAFTYSTDTKVAKSREIQLFNNNHSLDYCETEYHPIGDKKLYKYSINGGDKTHSVLFDSEGALNSVFGVAIAQLDIKPTDSAETVQALLEPSIAYLIDVNKYDYVSVQTWTASEKEDHFGSYMYIYYNLVDGYQTDWFTVLVWDDGTVTRFIIHDVGVTDINLNIDKNLENELLSSSLQTIYNTDSSKYVSYEYRTHPKVVVYNDELSIKYHLNVNVIDTSYQSIEMTRICEILIPISEL